MFKPQLKRTYDYSTAVTDLRRTGTHHTNYSPFSVSTTTNVIHPTVSPFQMVPPSNNNPSVILKNETKSIEPKLPQTNWTNTKDIQAIIARAIETEIEQSTERNFGTERYAFMAERVCAEKELPIPEEIKEILKEVNQRPNQKRAQVHYGYLSHANAVYYIIDQELYVYKIEELKQRAQKRMLGTEIPDRQPLMPVKVKQNCRKITEITFYDNLNEYSSLKIPQKNVLVLEYPYRLEIVNYRFEEKSSQEDPNMKKITVFTLISLGLCFTMETEKTEFVTITPANTLLYMDEKGTLVNLLFSRPEGKLKKKFKRESVLQHKSNFMSKCNGFMRKIKSAAFQALPFSFSFQLSKKKNLGLVYDEKRSRVFTWTLKGDRSTAIQKLQKQINVYEFKPTHNGPMKCIWTIPEEEILRELDYPVDRPKVSVSNILKADPDYNQEASLIVLLSNGVRVYLEIGKEQCKFRWKCHAPLVESLKEAIYRKNKSLFEMASMKDSNTNLTEKWGQKRCVESSKSSQQAIFSYFNDRSISVGLVRADNRMGMYLTARKNNQQGDSYDVFEVKLTNDFFKRRMDSYPTKNQIFQTKCVTLQTESSLKLKALEQLESMEQLKNSKQQTHPKPTSEGCHELLRQVHHGPRYFTYLSNHFISTFALVRPVDIVYYFVKCQKDIFCKMYLPSIIGVNQPEICCMLLQIYTAPQGTSYFVPKNYIEKIEDILKDMHSNANKIETFASTNLQSNHLSKQQKKQELHRNRDYDRLIEFRIESNDDLLKTNIRGLFATFCFQQKANHNVFEDIKLQISKKSREEIDFDANVEKLTREHKVQAKNCLVYLSRVLYPFWNAKTFTLKKGKIYLHALRKKLEELKEIVTLLKYQANDYWQHLGNFLEELHQTVEIFERIPRLPPGLTLSEAMQKNLQYFEPFIFETLHYNYEVSFIQKFKQQFPLYITSEFESLIKVYHCISKSTREKEIMRYLESLSSYPQYFINYLRKEKTFIDCTALRVRDQSTTFGSEGVEIPVLPLERLFPFYFEKINNPTVKMADKFSYMQLVSQKLREQKNSKQSGTQVVENDKLAKFQVEYQETHKCLKLQEQCKQSIEEILEQEMMKQKEKGSTKREQSGFLTAFFSKFSGFFGEQSQEKLQNLSKTSYQVKKKIHESHRTIFENWIITR